MIRNISNCAVNMETKCSGISFSESALKMSITKFSSNLEQSTDVQRLSIFSSLSHTTSTSPVNQTSRFYLNFPSLPLYYLGCIGSCNLLARIQHRWEGTREICVKLWREGHFEVCTKQSYPSQQKHTYSGNSNTSTYI